MEAWLAAAVDHLPRWMDHQLRITEQPGVSLAVVHRGRQVLAWAGGRADLRSGGKLTPRHAFRVASHSKAFTAAAVLKLREQGRLQLDDPLGRHVGGLHPQVAAATLAQLLSHSAGLVRDGADAGQWMERRPFLDEAELRADLAAGPVIAANTRFKYSNHGYGLLGLAIEAVTGEPYAAWVGREIVAASGLRHTLPDMPAQGLPRRLPLASGHSAKWPLGQRLPIPAAMSTRALAAATGFVSTASDLASFFASLSPDAADSVLSVASRREMTRRQWLEPHASAPRWYGLGTMQGTLGQAGQGWDWFGHTGGFPGTLTRTACVPAQQLAVSVLTPAADGPAQAWTDGVLQLLQAFANHGAPTPAAAAWRGRWWSLWGAIDLLPMGDKVLVANPGLTQPLLDAPEIGELRRDRQGMLRGRIVLAGGYASHGEPASLQLDARGRPQWLQLGGTQLRPEVVAARELRRRYGD